jgi:hypothetical protein
MHFERSRYSSSRDDRPITGVPIARSATLHLLRKPLRRVVRAHIHAGTTTGGRSFLFIRVMRVCAT